jgi:putative transposase
VLHQAIQVRIYPTKKQQTQLAPKFGYARWWWNYAMNKSIEVYQETGKGLGRSAVNALLPDLKKAEETAWLADCYTQILQATTLNLTTAYKNFFDKRAGLPKFKSKQGKHSIQYPQNVKIVYKNVKLPSNIGIVKAKIHRLTEGKIKTLSISKMPSGKYLASILTEVEGEHPTTTEGKIYGIDLGLKHFAVVTEGKKVSKYDNPKLLAKHDKNLKRQQQKLARKQKASNSQYKYRKVVAKVYERISNSRQDFLHKLSYNFVSDSLAVIVENLHVKGMVRNHNLAASISDVGLGTFTNFLAYKLKSKGAK